MKFTEITDITDPRLTVFTSLNDRQLRLAIDREQAILIAESPKVIRVALERGYRPVALLAEQRHLEGDAADIVGLLESSVPVYTGSREVLSQLTGYTLTRGVLCAMERPVQPSVADIVCEARRIAVIDGVSDTTNIGAIFRSAAALGVDAILMTRTSCDPFNRRSIRVSMGSVFIIPWTWLDGPISSLKDFGFKTMAMALKPTSIPLDSPSLADEPRLAIILGTEGDGLSDNVICQADYSVIIPMHNKVDSLNVATASAVAFWQLCPRKTLTYKSI